jgi:hypothetical protein
MKKHVFLFLTLTGLLHGCSKKIIESGFANDPVFSITGSFNGNNYTITAGKDSIYHFTSLQLLPEREMIEAMGLFSNQACPSGDCPGSVRFIFRSQISDTTLESRLANLPYLQDSVSGDVMYPVTITPIADTSITALYLELSTGARSVGRMPLITNLFSKEIVNIGIVAEMSNGIYMSSKASFLPQYPDSCQAIGIKATLENGIIRMQADPPLTSQTSYSYFWSNGYFGPTLELDFSPDTLYTVSITPANSACSASASFRLPQLEKFQVSTPTFKATTPGATTSIFQEGVEIQWTDADGIRYSTNGINNNGESFFILEEMKPYKENENGDPTVKLNIRYNCMLRPEGVSGNTANPIQLSGVGVIAVGQR